MNTEDMSAEELLQFASFLTKNLFRMPGPGKEALLPGYQDLSPRVLTRVAMFYEESNCTLKIVEGYAIIKNNNVPESLTETIVNFILPRGKR